MESLLTKSAEILELARAREPGSRERLLNAVTDLCEREGADCLSAESQTLLSEIFLGIVSQAEQDIRQRLAERLAPVAWAPPALISVLALDDIEIARPVIAKSPVLKDHDLIRLLVEATLEHQIEVARRPNISATVVSAIIDSAQPEVLVALAGNETADVPPLGMNRLVVASERIAGLRGSLARHPRLTRELAEALYAWVGDALRASIAQRFKLDAKLLAAPIDAAVAEAANAPEPRRTAGTTDREAMERRLVEKLAAADQLRPGYLLRALREGRLGRFEAALSTLGGFPAPAVRAAIDATRPEWLALACAGVGIDRSVFPTILSLVRALNGGRPPSATESPQLIAQAFSLSQEDASKRFRAETGSI